MGQYCADTCADRRWSRIGKARKILFL